MAMTTCKDCGKEISTDATKCPDCGAAIKLDTEQKGLLFGVLLVIALILYFLLT